MKLFFRRVAMIVGGMCLFAITLGMTTLGVAQPLAQSDSHYFPETKHNVKGVFWQYWQQHGGLAQQGYPLTEEFQERSDLNGKVYTVQYFQRAVFESHPENRSPYNVLLSQLGTFRLGEKYPNGIVSQGAAGEVGAPQGTRAIELIGQVDQNGEDFAGYGYLTHIAGLPDDQLFVGQGVHSEASARFTFYGPAKQTARSVISNVIVIDAVGTVGFYLNNAPGGDFSNPASFKNGTQIADFSVNYQSILNVQAPNRGVQTLTGDLAQNSVNPFSLGGQSYRLGRPGLLERLDFTGEGVGIQVQNPPRIAVLFGAGHTTVTGQGAP